VGAVVILLFVKLLKAIHILLTPTPARSASGLRVETGQECDKQKNRTLFLAPEQKILDEKSRPVFTHRALLDCGGKRSAPVAP
jgi:hypothetical protein